MLDFQEGAAEQKRNESHPPVMVSAGDNHHTLGRRTAALSTPHRTRYATASRETKKQDLKQTTMRPFPSHDFQEAVGMIFLPNKHAIRRRDANTLKIFSKKL